MSHPYARHYTDVQTSTVPPGGVLLLLYEGAIGFLGRAREDLVAGRLGPGKTALSKALAIIAELQNSLDPEAGWEGAEGLSHLYGHMILELTEANVKGDLMRIERVRDLLTGLYGAWTQAVESGAAAPAPVPDPPRTGGTGGPAGAGSGDRAPFRVQV
jgi:flagellar secretion chaperone FliS